MHLATINGTRMQVLEGNQAVSGIEKRDREDLAVMRAQAHLEQLARRGRIRQCGRFADAVMATGQQGFGTQQEFLLGITEWDGKAHEVSPGSPDWRAWDDTGAEGDDAPQGATQWSSPQGLRRRPPR
ncbi:hypothetical protein MASR1M8_01950 [Thermomonas brevis]